MSLMMNSDYSKFLIVSDHTRQVVTQLNTDAPTCDVILILETDWNKVFVVILLTIFLLTVFHDYIPLLITTSTKILLYWFVIWEFQYLIFQFSTYFNDFVGQDEISSSVLSCVTLWVGSETITNFEKSEFITRLIRGRSHIT